MGQSKGCPGRGTSKEEDVTDLMSIWTNEHENKGDGTIQAHECHQRLHKLHYSIGGEMAYFSADSQESDLE